MDDVASQGEDPSPCLISSAVHNFLDAFYLSRIGIRMLIGQYLELREPPKPDYIGLVCLVSMWLMIALREKGSPWGMWLC